MEVKGNSKLRLKQYIDTIKEKKNIHDLNTYKNKIISNRGYCDYFLPLSHQF